MFYVFMKNIKVIFTTLFVFCGIIGWAQDNALKLENGQCQVFLKYENSKSETIFYNPVFTPSIKVSRQNLFSAELVVKCGEESETYEVLSFSVAISDGRGGFEMYDIKGNKFASFVEIYSKEISSVKKFIIEKIKIEKDGKTSTIAFPVIGMP